MLKPAVLVVFVAVVAWGVFAWYQNNLVQARAQALANRFGAGDQAAVLEAWQAPDSVRMRLFTLESGDPNLLDPAAKIGWPLAHGDVEPTHVLEAADLLRSRLQQTKNEAPAAAFAGAYAAVASQWLEIHRGNREWEMRTTSRILAMAGQPFLKGATPLLAALEALAGRTFGDDVGAAVAWWVEQYKGDPASLRPPYKSAVAGCLAPKLRS